MVGRRVSAVVAVVAILLPLRAAGTAGAAVDPAPGPGSLTASRQQTCALDASGGVWCWGENSSGQLGDQTIAEFDPVPGPVIGLDPGVQAVTMGGVHACALTGAGGVRCWGEGGWTGDGTEEQRLSAVDVVGLTSGVEKVSAASGGGHTCAVTTAGAARCWGFNAFGALGDGTTFDRNQPVGVIGLSSGVADISAGGYHTCAVTDVGGVWCWGVNEYGQLGDGTLTHRSTPVPVIGLSSGVRAVVAGRFHTCAVMIDGTMRCWGENGGGQLGDGTTTRRAVPVAVTGLSGPVDHAVASEKHTCAVVQGGSAECWGANADGQLGDGTTVDRSRAAPAVFSGGPVATIAVGDDHSCAFGAAGGLRCWGRNAFGQLGDHTRARRSGPVDVSGSFFRPECPTIVAAPNTAFSLADGYAVDSVATFTADPGFDLVGAATSTCTDALTWSAPPPVAVSNVPPTLLPGLGTVVEGDSGTAVLEVPVTLSAPAGRPVSAEWATVFTPDWDPVRAAIPGVDYAAVAGTVTFAPGETEAVVEVPVLGDVTREAAELVVLAFHDPVFAVIGGYGGLGFGQIVDDEPLPVVLPGEASVVEGDAGTTPLSIGVSLSGPSSVPVTVRWRTVFDPDWSLSLVAAPGSEYVEASGTVTFPPGATSASVTVLVIGDLEDEDNELVVPAFTDATNARIGGFWGLGFGVIVDDD